MFKRILGGSALILAFVCCTACSRTLQSQYVPTVAQQKLTSIVQPANRKRLPEIPATITQFSIPHSYGSPYAITTGPDGALWFSQAASTYIGRIAPPSRSNPNPVVTEYSVGNETGGMVSGKGGIWISQLGSGTANHILKVVPATSGATPAVTTYSAALYAPFSMAFGPTKSAVWLADANNSLGKMSLPGAGGMTNFTTIRLKNPRRGPRTIIVGPDKAMWFTECVAGKVGRISSDGSITELKLPSGAHPTGITVGPDNALWYVDGGLAQVGRISKSGAIKTYSIPKANQLRGPVNIISGPDRALWFTSVIGNGGAIGRMTLNGTFSKIEKGLGVPSGITIGPDGALWVTELPVGNTLGQIARIQLTNHAK